MVRTIGLPDLRRAAKLSGARIKLGTVLETRGAWPDLGHMEQLSQALASHKGLDALEIRCPTQFDTGQWTVFTSLRDISFRGSRA